MGTVEGRVVENRKAHSLLAREGVCMGAKKNDDQCEDTKLLLSNWWF
jgi:hypothetical protein